MDPRTKIAGKENNYCDFCDYHNLWLVALLTGLLSEQYY
jgi:hypothetical protein